MPAELPTDYHFLQSNWRHSQTGGVNLHPLPPLVRLTPQQHHAAALATYGPSPGPAVPGFGNSPSSLHHTFGSNHKGG